MTVQSFLSFSPILAHHPAGGMTPSNFVGGFLSGLGHPVIGVDHLAFIIAIGLIAPRWHRGWLMPILFVATAIAGTMLHLRGADLPQAELWIAASVLIFGTFLALDRALPSILVMALAALAGLCHGYAYGEAIIGAEMNPLLAYLLGFSAIQLAIAAGVYAISKRWQLNPAQSLNLRFSGFLITGLGLAFTSGVLLG